ncbi:DUF5753 domain-containing protein [Micromonospora taraxaci]|uniref:DUF5753 domain-containing protein n=1 Tax=Micromonospora taraxaci TaxID=1316803 RepID=UPI003C2E2BB4
MRGRRAAPGPPARFGYDVLRATGTTVRRVPWPGPPLLVAVLDEGVLRRTIDGDRAMMREQCERLVEQATLPNVSLFVVPADVGMYPGLGGPFTVAEMPDGARVAHVDSQAQAQLIDKVADVATLDRRWERIRDGALSRAQSLNLIREAAASWT